MPGKVTLISPSLSFKVFFFSCSNNALRCRPSLMEINHFKCIIILIGGSYYFCQGEFHLQCIFVGSQ